MCQDIEDTNYLYQLIYTFHRGDEMGSKVVVFCRQINLTDRYQIHKLYGAEAAGSSDSHQPYKPFDRFAKRPSKSRRSGSSDRSKSRKRRRSGGSQS